MKTSKIIKITSNFSERSNKRYYDIELENWDKWTIANDNENAYKEWQELNYELWKFKNESAGLYRINEARQKKWWSPRNYNAEFAMKALECAVEFAPVWKEWQTLENTLECADEMFKRLKNKSLSTNQPNNG